jgi:CheY-like chemotaxis protein
MEPGNYVAIRVVDSGTGMDEVTKIRIFEPFFTTKSVGEGTGLGLSTCYGIVRQAGGYIWADSIAHVGTTFEIRLPISAELNEAEVEVPTSGSLGGAETVLLAEDEGQIRALGIRALQSLGYVVLAATNGREALELARGHRGTIHLLLTDVVMPEIGGKDLADKLSKLLPNLKSLYLSGYATDSIVNRAVLEPGTRLLDKPFTPESLGRAVRQALDA